MSKGHSSVEEHIREKYGEDALDDYRKKGREKKKPYREKVESDEK